MRFKKSEKFKKFSHIVTGFLVFWEGIIQAEDFGHNWPFVFIFCSIGILIALFTYYEHRIERKWIQVPPLINILESIVLFLIGCLAIYHHKHWLPYAYFLAAAGNLTGGIVFLVKAKKNKQVKQT